MKHNNILNMLDKQLKEISKFSPEKQAESLVKIDEFLIDLVSTIIPTGYKSYIDTVREINNNKFLDEQEEIAALSSSLNGFLEYFGIKSSYATPAHNTVIYLNKYLTSRIFIKAYSPAVKLFSRKVIFSSFFTSKKIAMVAINDNSILNVWTKGEEIFLKHFPEASEAE